MRRAIRLLLAIVLAVALPLQGMATTTMALCGPAPQATASHAAHGHDAPSSADHHHQDDATATPDMPPMTKTSACASCCLAAAIPSPALVFDAVVTTARVAPAVSIGAAAFLTAPLERPPRAVLA